MRSGGGLLGAAPAGGGGLAQDPGLLSGATSPAAAAALLAGAPSAAALAGARRALTSRATRRALAHGALSQAQLERTVARLRQCLGQLPDRQDRVLSLRAGVGPRPALSRTQVARRLGLGVAETRRVERRGLRRLGALDGAGMCSATAATASPLGWLLGATTPLGVIGATAATDWSAADFNAVKGVSEAGGGGDGGGLALPPPIGDGADWTLLILLGLAAMLALLVRREVRRH